MSPHKPAVPALAELQPGGTLRSTFLVAAALLAGCGVGSGGYPAVDAQRAKPFQRYDFVQALAANERVVVAASQAGAVVVSADQGRSWRRQQIGEGGILDLVTCPDGGFVGIDFKGRGWLGDAAGMEWRSVPLAEPSPPLAVDCDARGRWWVSGAHAQVAMSEDKGASWRVIELSDKADDAQLTGIRMVDETHGFIVGEFGFVFATNDGGDNWTHVGTIEGEFYPYSAVFLSRDEGFASGIAGQVVRTRDGGKTWESVPNATGVSLYRLVRQGDSVFGVGGGGVVARVHSEGVRAVVYPDAVPVPLTAVANLGHGQQALVVGGAGGLSRVVSTVEVGS